MAAHDLVRTMNDRMPDSAKLYSHRDNDQSHETRDRVVHVATTAASADEKNQADGSLLSDFRSGPPIRTSSNGADFSRYTGDWLNQGGLKSSKNRVAA